MSKSIPFQMYSSVKVKGDDLERDGQVGVVVGNDGDDDHPVRVKFDDSEHGQVEEFYAVEQLEGM